MIRRLAEVLLGWPWCWHKWEVIERRKLSLENGSTGQRFYLQCARCGEVKKRDLA